MREGRERGREEERPPHAQSEAVSERASSGDVEIRAQKHSARPVQPPGGDTTIEQSCNGTDSSSARAALMKPPAVLPFTGGCLSIWCKR